MFKIVKSTTIQLHVLRQIITDAVSMYVLYILSLLFLYRLTVDWLGSVPTHADNVTDVRRYIEYIVLSTPKLRP